LAQTPRMGHRRIELADKRHRFGQFAPRHRLSRRHISP
jgi:hypothetical protein